MQQIYFGSSGLLFDARYGTWETVITLSALWELALDRFDIGKILVIAPKRVATDTWPKELQKWEHLTGLTASLVTGSQKQREDALARPAFLYIINRENVSWLVQNHRWDFGGILTWICICDIIICILYKKGIKVDGLNEWNR